LPLALTHVLLACVPRVSALSDVRNLNLWGNDLSDISVLRQCPNVEVVSLSVNLISSLAELSGCRRLRELYLRKNRIDDLKQILYLTALPDLRVLWLSDNPISAHPHYRDFILAKLPRLEKLDNTDVTEEEREVALKRSSDGLLSPMAVASNSGGAFTFSPRASAGAGGGGFGSPRRTGGFASPRRGGGLSSPRGFEGSSAAGMSPRHGAVSGPSSPTSRGPGAYAVRRASAVFESESDFGDPMRDGASDLGDADRDSDLHVFGSPSAAGVARVPPLHFPSPSAHPPVQRTPTHTVYTARREQQSAQLAAELAEEERARQRTDALEEEIRLLRLAEKAERDAETLARMRAGIGGGGGVLRSPRGAGGNAAAYSSPYASPRPSTARSHVSSVASAAPLSPRTAASAASYVSGSVSSRAGPSGSSSGQSSMLTSNQQYGALSSRPASARPAAGEKPNHMPAFARGIAAAAPTHAALHAPLTCQRTPARPATAAASSSSSAVYEPYQPLSPRSTYSMHTPLPSATPAQPSPAHQPAHAHPPAAAAGALPSSVADLTPRSTHGLAAPRSTQHNLLCACMAMIEEFDVAHLQWLQQQIKHKIAAQTQQHSDR